MNDADYTRQRRVLAAEGRKLLAAQRVDVGSLWIEKRSRKRVFRITHVSDIQINATPANPQKGWRSEEAWTVADFFQKHKAL